MAKTNKQKPKVVIAMSRRRRGYGGQAGVVNKKRVVIAMSGGVDSSVSARLLSKEYDTTGIFLHFWKEEVDGEEQENKCCSIKSLNDARRIARKIGIPIYTLNFNDVFKKRIVDDFLSEYSVGHTPNPCVRCNKFVKLGLLLRRAKELGFDKVASGHYARIKREAPRSKSQAPKFKLFKAKDKDKDQSYFLYAFSQDELAHLLFPLGEYTKDKVRLMAKKFDLDVAGKKDSQEICFISGKSHNDFLKRHLKLKPGPIKLLHPIGLSATSPCQGEVSQMINLLPLTKGERSRQAERGSGIIGTHQGLPLYTIGQRKGVEIGGTGPFYVAKFDYKKNILYVVNDGNDPVLFKDKLTAKKVNWISGAEPKLPYKCEAVIRYRHKPVKCSVIRKNKKDYTVIFKKPQRAITLGQSVVFYKGQEVLGGGIIS